MTDRRCSGCGTSGHRIDTCPNCRPGRPRGNHDARTQVTTLPPRSRRPERSPMPPANGKRTTWTLMFIPFGKETPVVLDPSLPTAQDGQRVAATYNALDWETHEMLGADKLLAMGRRGAFILEPVIR